MTSLQPWVTRALQTAGHIDENGNSRRARARHCRDCGLIVLTGYDADTCARLVTVDPTPLSPLGEALAHLAGRYTCALRYLGGRLELDTRHHHQIASQPAGTPGNRFDVLAQHRCGDLTLRQLAAPSWRPDHTTDQQPGTPPPF